MNNVSRPPDAVSDLVHAVVIGMRDVAHPTHERTKKRLVPPHGQARRTERHPVIGAALGNDLFSLRSTYLVGSQPLPRRVSAAVGLPAIPPRVKEVAQTIANQVQPKDEEEDRQARKDGKPDCFPQVAPGGGKISAP